MAGPVFKLPLLLVGVVAALALLAAPAFGDDPFEPEGPPLTPEQLAAIDKEMAAAIVETAKKPIVYTDEDLWYLNQTREGRLLATQAQQGVDPARGRNADFSTIVEGAVAVTGIIDRLVNTGTSIVSSLVDVGRFGLEVAKEVNRLIELKESRTGFLKGILYEVQWQTEELCNVIAFNLNKKHKQELSGIVYFARYEYEKSWVGVWVVEKGSFTNKAWFGKDEKWGFAGAWSQSGLFKDKVIFNPRPCHKVPT